MPWKFFIFIFFWITILSPTGSSSIWDSLLRPFLSEGRASVVSNDDAGNPILLCCFVKPHNLRWWDEPGFPQHFDIITNWPEGAIGVLKSLLSIFHPLVLYIFYPGIFRIIEYYDILKCWWLCLGLGFCTFILLPCVMPPYLWTHVFHQLENILNFHIAPLILSLVHLYVTATVQVWSTLFFILPLYIIWPQFPSHGQYCNTFLCIFYLFQIISTSIYLCHFIKSKCYLCLICWVWYVDWG